MDYSKYLKGKKIIFGITGGIAAYKAANCVSALRRAGAEVYVVMTKNATEFISPLTLKTLSEHSVITEMFNDDGYVTHISLTEIADLFIIAPASANCIAKYRAGIADDMLTTMLLAYDKDVLLVPSMNDNMLNHPATKENIEVLQKRNVNFVMPDTGKLATGKVGKGRFPENEKIMLKIIELLYVKPLINTISGNKFDKLKEIIKSNNFLVTCGATREYIDPVRYISNGSSGKMGFGFLNAISSLGGNVQTIAANYTDERINWFSPIKAESTEEFLEKIMANLKNIDWLIMAAAPSDYRVKEEYDKKIKKSEDQLNLSFIKNKDILIEVRKRFDKLNILGFAAETNDIEKNAKEKLEKKNLNAICLNKVYKDIEGFSQDKNELIFIDKNNFTVKIEKTDKEIAAYLILYYLFKKEIED